MKSWAGLGCWGGPGWLGLGLTDRPGQQDCTQANKIYSRRSRETLLMQDAQKLVPLRADTLQTPMQRFRQCALARRDTRRRFPRTLLVASRSKFLFGSLAEINQQLQEMDGHVEPPVNCLLLDVFRCCAVSTRNPSLASGEELQPFLAHLGMQEIRSCQQELGKTKCLANLRCSLLVVLFLCCSLAYCGGNGG